MSRRIAFAAFTSIAVFGGCAPSGPELYTVSGQVTFAGAPLNHGEIIFRAEGAASHAAQIVEGEYTLESTAGQKRVEITAVGTADASQAAGSGEPVIRFEAEIPARYNTQSELSATVSDDGPNRFDFQLTP